MQSATGIVSGPVSIVVAVNVAVNVAVGYLDAASGQWLLVLLATTAEHALVRGCDRLLEQMASGWLIRPSITWRGGQNSVT